MTSAFLAIGGARFAPDALDLLAPDGEAAQAAVDLVALPLSAAVELVAYELLERVRDALSAGHTRLCTPWWPPALARAFGVRTETAALLAGMLGRLDKSVAPDSDAAAVETCARLGLPPPDRGRYAAALGVARRPHAWPPRFAPPAPAADGARPARETAACLLVHGGRVLLERRPPNARVTPGVWDVPGGHVEAGEEPLDALGREMREELGLDPAPPFVAAAPLCVATPIAHEPPDGVLYRHHVYAARLTDAGAARVHAREGQEVAWIAPRAALRLTALNPLAGWVVQELRETGRLGGGAPGPARGPAK